MIKLYTLLCLKQPNVWQTMYVDPDLTMSSAASGIGLILISLANTLCLQNISKQVKITAKKPVDPRSIARVLVIPL